MLKVEDVDITQQLCCINHPAKESNSRLFKMSSKLTSMVPAPFFIRKLCLLLRSIPLDLQAYQTRIHVYDKLNKPLSPNLGFSLSAR